MSGTRLACRIEFQPTRATLEWIAWAWPSNAFEGWPLEPGGVRRDSQEQPLLLHFAPGRWLAAAPDAGQQAMLEAAAAGGAGVLTNVTGKWCALELSGPGAASLLAFTIDVAAVLAGRECAAVSLFDCPAILARSGADFRCWVQASYAGHFLDTSAQCGAALRRER